MWTLLVVAYDIFFEAFKEVKDGEIFSEYLLMIIATIGAFFIGEYHESIMVMLLFIVGELLQGLAVEKSRESIVKLVGVNNNKATVKRGNKFFEVDYRELKVGETIVLKKGQILMVDGKVVKGEAYVDESNLTDSLKAPVLSEGICLYNGKIAIVFESGASKYRVTARCVIEDIYFIK